MINRLHAIIQHKQLEVAQLKNQAQSNPEHLLNKVLQGLNFSMAKKSLLSNLRQPGLSVIAEIKRKSPSKGTLAAINDPIALAQSYVAGGASAISVLTDEVFFAGHLNDLTSIAQHLQNQAPAILRKDFILDEIQIAQAIIAGANAVLLIAAVLGDQLKHLLSQTKNLGIEALVEVHNQQEIDLALASGAEIIGINNRNLKTMAIDTQQALNLLPYIPKNIISVAESGILTATVARDYHRAGFDAVLIGEALVTSNNPQQFIEACRYDASLN